MIKVSILGAGSADGGELIRILAMHPDVEMVDVQQIGLEGLPLTARHHGLIGETALSFTASVDYTKCDVLFICEQGISAEGYEKIRQSRPDLKIIALEQIPGVDEEEAEIVYGVPEINRKALVRGATSALVPDSFASMALVALYPFASNLLLNTDIELHVSAPAAILDSLDPAIVSRRIEDELRKIQQSFCGRVSIEVEKSASRRSALMEIGFDCGINIAQAVNLYEIYDDHHFSFVTTTPVGVSEVAGTNKCVISVMQPEAGKMALGVAADCRLRGASGEAVHIMNLMCGLHEKTGLALKAIDFEPIGI